VNDTWKTFSLIRKKIQNTLNALLYIDSGVGGTLSVPRCLKRVRVSRVGTFRNIIGQSVLNKSDGERSTRNYIASCGVSTQPDEVKRTDHTKIKK